MAGWTLTAGLQNLRSQVNARWPGRDHTSDGTIGDEAHQAEMSGHNPDDTAGSKAAWNGDPDNDPEVRSWDMDSDLAEPGTTAQMIVDHVRSLPGLSSVLRYMIFNRRMYHVRDGFAPTPYSGPSPHAEHIHFEGAWSQAADNDTSFDYRLEEINMPTADEVAAAVWKYNLGSSGPTAAVALQSGFGLLKALMVAANAEAAEVPPSVQQIVDGVKTAFGTSSPEQTAAMLKSILGAQAATVGRLLAS